MTDPENRSLLRVSVFPGGFNWPIFVAEELGFFARDGLAIDVIPTTGSIAQMTDLARSACDIAMTAFDNIVAYVEGEGEAPIGAQPEFFAFLGSDDSFLNLVARADVASIADLRGRSVSVDAATTGYAFVLLDLLDRAGLERGDYRIAKVGGMAQRFDDLCRGGNAATLLSAPYDLLAERNGLRVLSRMEEPYQGNVAATRRDRAGRHPQLLTAYVRAYVDALSWLGEPENRMRACTILQAKVSGMTAELAAASYARMLQAKGGFSRTGRIDEAGARTVLRLRSRYGPSRRAFGDPGKYFDSRFWEQANVHGSTG